ncbi:MAG: radical SAM/SPASM domain-containing protein [Lachnospira sp.]
MGGIPHFKRIYIEITSCCNLHCSFCQETLRAPAFLKSAQFEHILREIKPYTGYIYLHVKGEPLLHPELEKILRLCREYKMTVNLTTNGTLLKKCLDVLVQYPVHTMNISFHSADDNDCIDMKEYVTEVFDSCRTILDTTDTQISVRLWNTKKDPTLFGERNLRITDKLHINVQSPFEWPDLNSGYYNDRGFCQGLRTHIAILSNGNVVPCCLDGNGVMTLGNIFETPLAQILSSGRAVQFIKEFNSKKTTEELCAHCSFKERFKHKM